MLGRGRELVVGKLRVRCVVEKMKSVLKNGRGGCISSCGFRVGGQKSGRAWWLTFRDVVLGEVLDGARSLLGCGIPNPHSNRQTV